MAGKADTAIESLKYPLVQVCKTYTESPLVESTTTAINEEVAEVVLVEEVEEEDDNSLLQDQRPRQKIASRQIGLPLVTSLRIIEILG